MGVSATLSELSEWTLYQLKFISLSIHLPLSYFHGSLLALCIHHGSKKTPCRPLRSKLEIMIAKYKICL